MRKTILVAATAAMLSMAVAGSSHGKAHPNNLKSHAQHGKKRMAAKHGHFSRGPKKALKVAAKPLDGLLSKVAPVLKAKGVDITKPEVKAASRKMALQQMLGDGAPGPQGSGPGPQGPPGSGGPGPQQGGTGMQGPMGTGNFQGTGMQGPMGTGNFQGSGMQGPMGTGMQGFQGSGMQGPMGTGNFQGDGMQGPMGTGNYMGTGMQGPMGTGDFMPGGPGGDEFNGGQKTRPDDGPVFFDEERERNRPAHCNSTSYYGALEARYFEACGRVDFSFAQRQFKSLQKASDAFDKFCTSECAGAMNALMAYQDGYSCLTDEMPMELSLISAMCQYDTTDTTVRCGAKLATSGLFTDKCERKDLFKDRRACEAEPGCKWNNDASDYDDFRTCEREVTADFLANTFCTDCAARLLSVISPTLNICTKVNGQLCYAKILGFGDSEGESSGSGADQNPFAIFDTICADPDAFSCFKWFSAGDEAVIRARDQYKDCIRWSRYSQYFRQPPECLSDFNRRYQEAVSEANTFDNICAKNSTTNGQLCMLQALAQTLDLQSIERDYGSCAYQAAISFGDGDCPTLAPGCDAQTEVQKVLNGIGCCTPIRTNLPSTPESAVPMVYGGDSLFTAEQKAAALQAGVERGLYTNFTNVLRCSGASLYDAAADSTCTYFPNGGPTEIGSWNTVISWAAMANATIANEISIRLAHDAGRAMGARAVNVIVALSEGTNGGTKATFSLKGGTQAADIAKQFWGQLTQPNPSVTDRFYNDQMKCKDCKSDPKHFSAIVEGRVFETIPGAPEDKCTTNAYITAYQGLLEACSGTDIDQIFELTDVNLAGANAVWESACSSSCLSKFREIRASDAGVCLPPDILTIGDLINVGCSQDSAGTTRCGAVLSVMTGVECSYLGETACNASSTRCMWTPARTVGDGRYEQAQCRDQYTESFLAPLCDSGCISKLAATLGGNKDGFAKEARLMDTMFCSVDYNADGEPKRCMPHIQNDINMVDENDGFFPDAVISDFCETDRSKLRCAKRIFSAVAKDIVHSAEYAFYDCVESVLDNSAVDAYGKVAYIDQYCIENVLAPILSSVDQTFSTLNNMCTKNSAGVFCLNFVNKYRTNACLGKMIENYDCSTTCGAEIKGIFTEMGCCVGNIQQIYGYVPFANLPEEDLPEFETFDDQFSQDEFQDFEKWTSGDGTNYYSDSGSGAGVSVNRRQSSGPGPQGPPGASGPGPQGPPGTGGPGPQQGGTGMQGPMGTGNFQGTGMQGPMGTGNFQGTGMQGPMGTGMQGPAPSRQTKGVIGTGKSGATANSGEELITGDFAKFNFFANYMFCPGVTNGELDNLLYKKCMKPRTADTITRSLDIGASKDTLASTPRKEKRFTKKLLQDLANRQGGSSEEYPSTTLNSGSSTGRRQSSTTTVSFTYQGETAEDNQAAATSYDKAVESGSLTLSSTVTLVKNECSDCTTNGGDATGVVTTAGSATLTSEYAPTPTPTPAPTEGAAAMSTILMAGVVALLSALLL